GAFHLTDLDAAIDDATMAVTARGAIRDLGVAMRAEIAVAAQRLSLARAHLPAAWAPFADTALALMPLRGAARVTSAGIADWRVGEIAASSLADHAEANMSGTVAAFAPLQGDFHFTASGPAEALLPPTWKGLRPPGAALDLAFDLTLAEGAPVIENLAATLRTPDAHIALRGGIGRFDPLERADLEVEFAATRVANLGLANASALNPDNPIEGRVGLKADAHRSHAKMEIEIGASDLRGTLAWHRQAEGNPNAVAWIEGDLRARRLDLVDLLTPAAKKTRLFPTAPLGLGWAGTFDARIALAAEEFNNRQLRIRDATMQLDLREGALHQTIAGRIGQGELAIDFALDAAAEPPAARFTMTGHGLDTVGLLALREDAYLDGGTFDAEIEFAAQGRSVADFAAAADGRVSLRLNQTRIKNDRLDAVGGDIFSNLVTVINPFRSIGEYVNVECAWMRFDITDGMAATENGLAMKTDKVTVFGGGQADFSDESLQIVLLPKARKGFGINPSSLVKIVRLGGTLAQPRIEAGSDPAKLLQTGVTVWAGLATGGLSLIAKGLYDRAHANTDLCNVAEATPSTPVLEAGEGASSTETGETASGQNSGESARTPDSDDR
ncbi:MAG: AsmA family protein, partial [bacterium]